MQELIEKWKADSEDKKDLTFVLAQHYANTGEFKKADALLNHPDQLIRWNAAQGIYACNFPTIRENEKRIPLLAEFLNDDASELRLYTVAAFERLMSNITLLKRLEEIQEISEDSFRKYKRKNQKDEIGIAIKKSGYSQVLVAIAKRKAGLSKEKGGLLLGETVKKPEKCRKNIYQSLRRATI